MDNKEVNNDNSGVHIENTNPTDLGNHVSNILRMLLQPNDREPRVRVNENKNEYYTPQCGDSQPCNQPCNEPCNQPCSQNKKCCRNSKTRSRRRKVEEPENDDYEEEEEDDEEEYDDDSSSSSSEHDRSNDSWDALLHLVDNQRKLCKAFLILLEEEYGVTD